MVKGSAEIGKREPEESKRICDGVKHPEKLESLGLIRHSILICLKDLENVIERADKTIGVLIRLQSFSAQLELQECDRRKTVVRKSWIGTRFENVKPHRVNTKKT